MAAHDKLYVAFDICGNPFAVSQERDSFNYMPAARVAEYRVSDEIVESAQNALRNAAIAMCPLCAGGNKYVSQEPLLEGEHTAGECRWFHRYSDTNEIAAKCESWKINDLIVRMK